LLTNDLFTVTTTATNGLFTSGSSPAGTVLFEAPAAPSVGGVIVGLGQVTVSVSPTTSGGPASSYQVFVGSSSCTVTPPATACTVTGLAGGQVYPVTVAASNGAGTTTGSNELQARLVAPNAPPAPTVYVASGSATVLVSPPVGGETPSSYVVTAQPGGQTCTVVLPDVLCEVTGLVNGITYTFTAVAVNAYGPSLAGLGTAAIVAEPSTPPAPTVIPGNQQAMVFVQPGAGGGTPSVYVVTAQPDGVSCTVTPPETSCVLTELTNDVEYTVTVIAANDVGSSFQSLAGVGTPRAPTSLPPGIGNLITSPVPTSTPPSTSPSTTVPVTSPSTTVPPVTTLPPTPAGVDPATGEPPVVPPGEVTVEVGGVPVAAQVEVVSPLEVVVRSPGFDMSIVAECATGCGVTTDADGQPVIQLEASGNVRVEGTGFMPGTVAYVWLFSEPRLLGVVTVKADGTFEGSLPLGGLDQGQHTLQVNGTNANGRPKAANLGVIVNQASAPIPGPGRLPATGNDGGSTMITVAVLLMLAGGLTRVGRRPVR
jgi:hypothetical protein